MINKQENGITISFLHLLKQALNKFPDEIILAQADQLGNITADSTCNSIFDLKEKIASNYIGEWDEVLMVNLLDAIYTIIRSASSVTKNIKLCDLREDVIKDNFEERLRDTLTIADLDWNKDDKALVKKYFEMNEA